ncbi:hypothetical protein K1T71_007128 [Dendrolimus kikuchii]|uniref:Uncharacterized protein n=1 Tax=Dendrolimus kikuchii TaxID=765133 RepID=A0ACC1CZG9_9NEOP|nr:hypothetical protein K1T71_007128 [Dendrolimus kikuchii]
MCVMVMRYIIIVDEASCLWKRGDYLKKRNHFLGATGYINIIEDRERSPAHQVFEKPLLVFIPCHDEYSLPELTRP